jgi:hypothetical protein
VILKWPVPEAGRPSSQIIFTVNRRHRWIKGSRDAAVAFKLATQRCHKRALWVHKVLASTG